MPSMTTHRSLNKLERRAHQNIHNTVEVTESAPADGYTRDRFGKLQSVPAERPDLARPRVVRLAALLLAVALPALVPGEARARSTDVVVSSDELGRDGFGDLPDRPERPVFYRDTQVTGDINEDGDPNLNMRF